MQRASQDSSQTNQPTIHISGTLGDLEDSIFYSLSLFGSIYGGVHLLAWTGPFPSANDRLWWRMFAISLASSLPFFYLWGLILKLLSVIHIILERFSTPKSRPKRQEFRSATTANQSPGPRAWIINLLRALAHGIFAAALTTFLLTFCGYVCGCVVARFYLVGQSFASLAYLPEKVYEEPDWVRFFLHITAG